MGYDSQTYEKDMYQLAYDTAHTRRAARLWALYNVPLGGLEWRLVRSIGIQGAYMEDPIDSHGTHTCPWTRVMDVVGVWP